MVKGISRQVIWVHSPETDLFEQAIFILKDSADPVTDEMLLKEGLAEVMYIPPSEFVPYDWTNENTPHHTTQKTTAKSTCPT